MAKFKNAKEWGNFVRDKVLNEIAVSYKNKSNTPDVDVYLLTDKGKEFLTNIIFDVASEIFEELLDLVNNQKDLIYLH